MRGHTSDIDGNSCWACLSCGLIEVRRAAVYEPKALAELVPLTMSAAFAVFVVAMLVPIVFIRINAPPPRPVPAGGVPYPFPVAPPDTSRSAAATLPSPAPGILPENVSLLHKWDKLVGGDGQLLRVTGITVSPHGKVYVADGGNRRVQVFTSGGDFLTSWGPDGNGDGQFESPLDLAVDGSENVYLIGEPRGVVQVFSGNGEFLR